MSLINEFEIVEGILGSRKPTNEKMGTWKVKNIRWIDGIFGLSV